MPTSPKSPKARNPSATDGVAGIAIPRCLSPDHQNQSPPLGRSSPRELNLFNECTSPDSAGEAFGSLACELAEAWDQEDAVEDADMEDFAPDIVNNANEFNDMRLLHGHVNSNKGVRRDEQPGSNLVESGSPFTYESNSDRSLTSLRKEHRRSLSGASLLHKQEYRTFDFMNGHINDVEILSKPPDYSQGSKTGIDGDILRVIDGLKSLKGQTEVETKVTRLITAHSALAMHVAQQSRILQTLSFNLLSTLSPPLSFEHLDDIISIVVESIALIPHPHVMALSSLSLLAKSSKEVIEALDQLGDSLHMYRQIAGTAMRSLRSTKALVAQMRKEIVASELGCEWIEHGNWSQRLADRQCASICEEVIADFERICEDYRGRLVAQSRFTIL